TVDHVEPEMIQIGDFVHRLGDRQAKNPLLRSELFGCDGTGLVSVGPAVDSGRDQVAQAAAAQEVSQADETRTVPREKHRATARLAVVLGEHALLVDGDVELALQHTVGPAQVNQVGGLLFAQADDYRTDRLGEAGIASDSATVTGRGNGVKCLWAPR